MIADAQRIGNDGECRIYRAGGAEKAAIHDVKIVELVLYFSALGVGSFLPLLPCIGLSCLLTFWPICKEAG